jgi:hypothetical protein
VMNLRVGASSGSVGANTMIQGKASSLMSGYHVMTMLRAASASAGRVAQPAAPRGARAGR